MDLLALYEACGVRRLPVDPGLLAHHLSLSLITYEQFCRETGTDMLSLLRAHNPDAFTHVFADGCVVAYNRQCTPGRRRWSVTHELSHILLNQLNSPNACDASADRLTADILCPLPVVSLCGVRSVREMHELCGISHEAATFRWKELCAFRRGERGPWTEADWALVRYFHPFISAVLDGFSPQTTTPPVY